jgi:type I restriction enzyme M protein
MPSPLTVKRNDYHARPKRSDVYTPPGVARFLFDVLGGCNRWDTILDPAIGTGQLTNPWYDDACRVVGIDIVDRKPACQRLIQGRFEDQERVTPCPDLVLCNPPFNGAAGKQLYPEVFLRHAFKLFGETVPVVLFTPMGFRLNQRRKSARWRWLRDTRANLTSIVSLPLDTFPGVEFHAEILIFNIKGIRPHYFLPETAL